MKSISSVEISSYFVCYSCITVDQTLSLHFFVRWFWSLWIYVVFKIMLWSAKNTAVIISIKSTLILTFIIKLIINIQTYRTTLPYTPLTIDANPGRKGCLTASKLIKNQRNRFIPKSYFAFYVLFIISLQLFSVPSGQLFLWICETGSSRLLISHTNLKLGFLENSLLIN